MSDDLDFRPSRISDKSYFSVLSNIKRFARSLDSDYEKMLEALSKSLDLNRCLLIFTNATDTWSPPFRHFEHVTDQVPIEFSDELEKELITIFEDIDADYGSRLTTALAKIAGTELSGFTSNTLSLHRNEFAYGQCFGVLVAVRDFGQQFSIEENQLLEVTAHLLQATLDTQYWKNQFNQVDPRDPLTGLLSKQEILKFCQWECQRVKSARFAPRQLAIIGVDIDNLRKSNDCFGFGITDDVIKAISSCVQECVQPGQLAGRYGGNEFVILLPDCEQNEAESFAEVLRAKIAGLQIPKGLPGDQFCTASFGIVLAPKHASTPEELIEKMIGAIVLAKAKGKNCVVAL